MRAAVPLHPADGRAGASDTAVGATANVAARVGEAFDGFAPPPPLLHDASTAASATTPAPKSTSLRAAVRRT